MTTGSGVLEGCASCDHGWRYVTEAYVAELYPIPPNATEEQRLAVFERRELYAEHVFPCSECRPEAFARWANGCMRADHRAGKCELCTAELGGKGAARQDRAAGRLRPHREEF